MTSENYPEHYKPKPTPLAVRLDADDVSRYRDLVRDPRASQAELRATMEMLLDDADANIKADAGGRDAELQEARQFRSRVEEEIFGFSWLSHTVPDDLIERIRLLRRKADNGDYWRAQSQQRTGLEYHDRQMKHMRTHLFATREKLRQVRAAARAYQSGRDFAYFEARHAAGLTTERPPSVV